MADSWGWLNESERLLTKRHVKGVYTSHVAVYQAYYDNLRAQFNQSGSPSVWDGLHLVLEDDLILGACQAFDSHVRRWRSPAAATAAAAAAAGGAVLLRCVRRGILLKRMRAPPPPPPPP